MTLEIGFTEEQQHEEKRKQLRRAQEEADVKAVLETPAGKRYVWRLLGITGVFRNPMQGDGDANTNFRCGMQAVGQTVLGEIHELCPERYSEMVKEQQRSDDAERAAAEQ